MSVEDFSQSLLHAAQCLKVGNHAEASSVLRKLQDLDGTIGVDVATQVLKETPADGVVATYVHFAALRLLRFILIGNWVFWSTQKDNVVNFLYEYIRDRMTVLIQSLWKPVLRESCMVLAIVFKLGCIRTQGAGGVDEEATQRLVDFLRRQSFNAASGIPDSADCEVSTTRVDVLRRLLIICTVEEFGLYEPAAAERGVPMAHHEASHAVFATKGVPAFLSDLLSEALRPDSETRLSASYLFRALSTLLAWRGISLQDEDTGAQTLDDGAGCFEADQASWHSLYTIGVPNGPLAPVHLADILWRWYELTRVVSDTYAPLADAALHHSVVEVTAQCCGIYCERAEASTLRGSASSNSQEEIAFASRLLDVVHRMVVEKLSFRFPLLPVEPLAMIAPHLVLGRAADGEAYAGDDGDLLASLNGIAKLLDNFAAPGGAMCNAVFASQVAHVVSHIFMQLIHGCRLQPDTNDLMAALDAMLGAWRGVIARNIVDVTGSVALPPECRRQLQQVSGSAFSTFVSAKTQLDSSGLPEVESGEGEALSCSQIKLMAFLGQQTPEESCELMIQTLATIAPIYLPTVSGGGTGSVAILHDRMWTTLVVAAGLIGEVVDSERVTIPSCFLELVDRRQLTTETNPVLRLALGVFSFAEQLRMFYSSGTNSSAVSPAVVTAVLTFVEHYVSVYVDTIEPAGPSVNSDDYLTGGSAYSRGVFQAAFDCGKDVLRAALRHVVDSLRYYPFDEGVASGARAVLERLCEKQHHVARWVCAQPEFLALSELALGTVTRFGGRVRGHVIGCLVSLTLADASVLGAECPALKVLESMLLAELGSQRTNDLLEVMDNLRGVFTALRSDNAIDASFPFLSQLVHRCIATAVAKENERQVLVAAMELVYDMFYSCSPFLRPEMSWQNVSIVFAAIEAAEQSLLRAGSAALLTGGQSADSEEEERTRLVRALGKTLSSVSEWATLDVSLTKEQYNEVGVRIVKGISVLVRLLDSHLLCIPQVHDVVFQSLADVSNSFTSHFVTANESLSLLEALHFAAYASSVELNRCALAIIDNISSFLRDSGRAAGSAGLLLDFLLAALEMLVGGRISGSLARKQVTCLISLCESLGVDTVREVFVSTASRHPSFAAVLEALYTTLSGLPMTNMDRRAFTAQLDREVHEAIVTIKGTRIVGLLVNRTRLSGGSAMQPLAKMKCKREVALQSTAYDACSRKIHSVAKGYLDDPFTKAFAKDLTIVNSPLMNRGTWLRTKAVENSIVNFAQVVCSGRPIQVVSFGAGADTLYFRLKRDAPRRQSSGDAAPAGGVQLASFVEIDLPAMVADKQRIIDRHPDIQSLCGPEYHLCGGNLLNADEVVQIVTQHIDRSLPTVLLAEMVFVYLNSTATTNLMQAMMTRVFSATECNVLFVSYDAIEPNDRFGEVMVENLASRNVALEGIDALPTPAAHAERCRQTGFRTVHAMSMRKLYLTVPQPIQKQLNQIEMVDDWDEWGIVHDHYCFVLAWTGVAGEQDFPLPFSRVTSL